MRAGLLLLVVAFAAMLPVVGNRSWLGTEGRRVEIAREMAATGELVVPTLGLEPTLAKPPFYYWVLAGTSHLFGHGQAAMRVPSILALWLFAWLAFGILCRSHDEGVGWLAALGVLCSPVVIWHGGLAEIDPMFAAFSAGSILLLGRAAAYGGTSTALWAGALGGLAMLTKGPPYLLCLLGPLLVSIRRRRLRPWLPFALLLALPPIVYYLLLKADPAAAALGDVAQTETVDRLFTYEWKHVADIPAYLVRVVAAMLPFGFFAFAEYRGTHEARPKQAEIQQRFCTSAALGAVLVIGLFPGRATRYLLPAVLLFCVGIAPRVAGYLRYPAPIGPVPRNAILGLALMGGLGLCVLPWLPFPLPGGAFWFAGALGVLGLACAERSRVAVFALVVPVLASWTVLADRATRTDHGVRSSEDTARILRDEIVQRGIAVEDLATFGHFDYARLFWLDAFVPGDEFCRREPTAPWLLVEQTPELTLRPEGYEDVVRIRARNRAVVLQRRTAGDRDG